MKDSCVVRPLAVCLLLALFVSPVMAYWDEPLFLAELNDVENSYTASRPTISADENTIFFVRKDNTGQSRVWQAERNLETGVFENPRMLAELQKEGKSVYGTWMSEDGTRLYYTGNNSSWTRRRIWMATRNSPDEQWQDTKVHSELEFGPDLLYCTLTRDELNMMYVSSPVYAPGPDTVKTIYLATRFSPDESFSSFREVEELNAIGAEAPTISADGLTVYFILLNEDTSTWELWSGYRESLTEPFSDFLPLEDVNSYGDGVYAWCSPSWDGQRLYYFQRHGEPGATLKEITGIYVTQWVDPPEVVVDMNLTALIEEKTAMVEQLAAAIEMEIETLEILDYLQEMKEKGSEDWWAIQKTKIQLRSALRNEIYAQMSLRKSISELEEAAAYYRGDIPAKPKTKLRQRSSRGNR